MKYLITSSLLDSFDWLKNCPANWKNKAMIDFISMLKREKSPVSMECQRGIDFENLVCQNCNNKTDNEFKEFVSEHYKKQNLKNDNLNNAVNVTCKIAEKSKNGSQQAALFKDINIGGQDFHLFGYADIIHNSDSKKIIYDIKTCTNYKGAEYYEKRSQHYLYSLCTGIKSFEYLVADFKNSIYPQNFYSVNVSNLLSSSFDVLAKRIQEVMNFIELSGFLNDYKNIFCKGHKGL